MAKRSARPATPPPAPRPPVVHLRWVVLAGLAIATVVRLGATWNDLWLDEIWTLSLLGGLHSPLEILTTLRHDNNHVLNTVLLYLLRPLGSDWLFRLPALIAGIATVALGALVVSTDDPAATAAADAKPEVRALAATLVLGISHPLIQYASEARGYALALAFGLAAVLVVQRDGLRPWSRAAPACWILLVLAFLSHALALHLLTALAAWGAVRTLRRGPFPASLATWAWWFAVPLVAFGAFYAGFLEGITVGGGNREGIGPPLTRAMAVVSGLPLDLPLAVTLPLVFGVAAAGLWVVARSGSDLWVLFVVGIVVSPAALALVQRTNLYAERYFLVSMLLWLLLLARVLASLATRGGVAATGAALAFAVFALANGTRVAALLEHGRGRYQDALRVMVSRTTDDVAEIASDHDFRNRLVVEYFGPRMTKRVRYVSRAEPIPTQWYLAQRSAGERPPATHLTVSRGQYHLVRSYPTAMLSGLAWFVYERDTP